MSSSVPEMPSSYQRSPLEPRGRGVFYRIVHHPHVHLGANALSSLMGFALMLWVAEIFWLRKGAPPVSDVFWACSIYLAVEPLTAALTVMSKERWLPVIVDMLVAVALFFETGVVLYDHDRLMVTGVRAEIASYFFFTAFAGLVGGILISMVVNTRTYGGAPIAVTQQ